MTYKYFLLCLVFFFGLFAIQAQEKSTMTLEEAIDLALTESNEIKLANTKATTKQFELQSIKSNQYPDLKISGQYQRLKNADINLKLGNSGNGGSNAPPKVNQLLLGQASFSIPLFSGFKIKNQIKAANNLYQAENSSVAYTKEQIAIEVVKMYVNLYKAQESVTLIKENIKNTQQRVDDFSAMEKNGLLARNDLLKAQLQFSSFQVTLDEAKKNVTILNYQLITFLKLPESTKINVKKDFSSSFLNNVTSNNEEAIQNRNDLEALRWQQKASEKNVKIARSAYYPSLSLLAGYIALDLQNILTMTNAINFGVGVSYDVSSIFKNGKGVEAIKSKASEAEQAVEILTDQIKIQVKQAEEDYKLTIKQNDIYTMAVNQAIENYRIVKDKYDNGIIDTNDLLEADFQQLQSKINQAFSKADITQKYYEMLASSGKLIQSFNNLKN